MYSTRLSSCSRFSFFLNRYLFTSTLRNDIFNSEAISLEWNEIEQTSQALILALMRTVSGGFLVCSISIFFLQFKFSSDRLSWIPLLILIIGIITESTILYATLIVRLNSPGNPPTSMAIVGIVFLITAYILNRIALRK